MRAVHSLALAVLVGVIAMAAPAVAHEQNLGASWLTVEDHPGWYWPSTSSKTTNFEMIGSVSRTRADSTYRNSDLAFWGRMAYAGHYDGFQIVDIGNPRKPEQITDFNCPGSQHDVSTWGGRLLFVSVETPRSGPECNSVPQSPGFEGMRIFDVSNPRAPSLIKGVPTDCGSHTHTLVPDLKRNRVLLYVASYTASVIPESSYGNKCVRLDENGQRAHNKISVVEVPLDDPASASVVSEPRFPQNDRGGVPGYRAATTSRSSARSTAPPPPAWARARSGTSASPSSRRRSPASTTRTWSSSTRPCSRTTASAWCSATRRAAAPGRAAARRTRRRSAPCGSTT